MKYGSTRNDASIGCRRSRNIHYRQGFGSFLADVGVAPHRIVTGYTTCAWHPNRWHDHWIGPQFHIPVFCICLDSAESDWLQRTLASLVVSMGLHTADYCSSVYILYRVFVLSHTQRKDHPLVSLECVSVGACTYLTGGELHDISGVAFCTSLTLLAPRA